MIFFVVVVVHLLLSSPRFLFTDRKLSFTNETFRFKLLLKCSFILKVYLCKLKFIFLNILGEREATFSNHTDTENLHRGSPHVLLKCTHLRVLKTLKRKQIIPITSMRFFVCFFHSSPEDAVLDYWQIRFLINLKILLNLQNYMMAVM